MDVLVWIMGIWRWVQDQLATIEHVVQLHRTLGTVDLVKRVQLHLVVYKLFVIQASNQGSGGVV